MVRDSIAIVGLMFVGLSLTFLVGYFIFTGLGQDTAVQGLNESVRVTAQENMDRSSRVQRGEVYIDRKGFEDNLKKTIKDNMGLKGDVDINIGYLPEDEREPLKAIKVKVTNGDKEYQSTVQVDISED